MFANKGEQTLFAGTFAQALQLCGSEENLIAQFNPLPVVFEEDQKTQTDSLERRFNESIRWTNLYLGSVGKESVEAKATLQALEPAMTAVNGFIQGSKELLETMTENAANNIVGHFGVEAFEGMDVEAATSYVKDHLAADTTYTLHVQGQDAAANQAEIADALDITIPVVEGEAVKAALETAAENPPAVPNVVSATTHATNLEEETVNTDEDAAPDVETESSALPAIPTQETGVQVLPAGHVALPKAALQAAAEMARASAAQQTAQANFFDSLAGTVEEPVAQDAEIVEG